MHRQKNANSHGIVIFALFCALLTVLAAGDVWARDDEKKPKRLEFPHAGIEVEIPDEFLLVKVEEPYDVMKAEIRKNEEVTQALSLSVLPVDAEMSANRFADMTENNLRKNLAVRKLKVLRKVPITVASHNGTARSMTYTYRGVKTTAARVYFIRRISPKAGAVCYMLTSEASPKKQDKLLPALDKLLKSVKLTPMRSAIHTPVNVPENPVKIEDHVRGFAVKLPLGWYVQNSKIGITLAQTDYLLGGQPGLSLEILKNKAPAGTTAKSYAELCVRKLQIAPSDDTPDHIISRSRAALGDMDAYQIVMKLTPPGTQTAPTSGPQDDANADKQTKPQSWIIINQTACTATHQQPGNNYLLMLVCRGKDHQAAAGIMDKLAEGFSLLSPASAPATKPGDDATDKSTNTPPEKSGRE